MSDGILKALMQLFAIIAGKSGSVGREAVSMVLEGQLNTELTEKYLKFYDEYVLRFYKTSDLSEKKRSMASVKVLRMCEEINEELEQQDKILVMLRLAEFVSQYDGASEQEWEFIQTVGEVFHIPPMLYQQLLEMARLKDLEQARNWVNEQVCIAGGVSANNGLRNALMEAGQKYKWEPFVPPFEYCTDNAGMIAITAYYQYLAGQFTSLDASPSARAVWA